MASDPNSVGLAEIVLIVEDVRRAADFYQEVVQLAPATEADEKWAWFWAGEPGVNSRIALHRGSLLFEEHSPLGEKPAWGPIHFAINVPRDEVEARSQHVRDRGVEVYGPKQFRWMGATSYYFYDPDANLVEFWSPEDEGEDG
jgi:catechol 2,3-dioxygenase-like lactoylglutathione lyase family enzyme